MDREKAKELLPIIQAFAEGKTIQVFISCKDRWEDNNNPLWDANADKYRIKPEPKYRPFKDADECWEEMQKHQPFGWIKDKSGIGNECSVITNISYTGVYFINYSNGWKSPYRMFSDVTFFDGSPFGIKVEDEEE